MKTVTMYKTWSYLDDGEHWGWSAERKYGDWEPFKVEIPDDFHLGETKGQETRYFHGDDPLSYDLFISSNSRDGVPVLVGGSKAERVSLKVVGEGEA